MDTCLSASGVNDNRKFMEYFQYVRILLPEARVRWLFTFAKQ